MDEKINRVITYLESIKNDGFCCVNIEDTVMLVGVANDMKITLFGGAINEDCTQQLFYTPNALIRQQERNKPVTK